MHNIICHCGALIVLCYNLENALQVSSIIRIRDYWNLKHPQSSKEYTQTIN
jgi:hypothetical protein